MIWIGFDMFFNRLQNFVFQTLMLAERRLAVVDLLFVLQVGPLIEHLFESLFLILNISGIMKALKRYIQSGSGC